VNQTRISSSLARAGPAYSSPLLTSIGAGCATRSPNSGQVPEAITIRGAGSGLTGYCYLSTVVRLMRSC
jgi:hypothetical protein